MKEKVRLFRNDFEARFVIRPNRFLIIAEKDGKKFACHCPNPGRLTELLFPGTELILEKRSGPGTGWTTVALKKDNGNGIVPLCSSRANEAAEKLILRKIIPNLKEFRREYRIGESRFDFFCIDNDGRRHLVEVKACSLVERRVAMFPDAPSARALKHLEELAYYSRKKEGFKETFRSHVLFVIMHGKPEVFIPNLHTDPAFAGALCNYGAETIMVHAALIRCGEDGMAFLAEEKIPLGLGPSLKELAVSDAGNYLILLELPGDCCSPGSCIVEAGSLGELHLKRGWYVYAGSGRKNLSARIARHLRKQRKKKHWHIDYLTPYAVTIKAFPVMTFRNLECDLAADLEKLGGTGISGFGCSDCRCKSHFFYFSDPPMENRDFLDMLFSYRHVECFKQEYF
jgi:sugar fermentation stimulation protein A